MAEVPMLLWGRLMGVRTPYDLYLLEGWQGKEMAAF